MGFFWNKMPYARVPAHAIMLQEAKGTLSRKWPILWHLCQYWCLLKVDGDVHEPYYLYRYMEGKPIVRYHDLIHTPFALAQVGPEKTYFWAETRTHKPLTLVTTGIKKPDVLAWSRPNALENNLAGYTYTRA